MAVYLTTDPRTGAGYAAAVGRAVRYIDAGTLLVLFKYGTGDTDWCTALAGYTTPVTTDPRSAGLAAPIGTSVLYVSSHVGTRLVKYDTADTDWAEQAAIGGSSGGITPRRVVGATFDGNGSAPTAGSVGYAVVPFNGTIDQWHIVGDASGSAVVDVWKAAGTIPTDANRIAGTEKPTLSAAQLASDTSLTTWSTLAVSAGDVFGFELESSSTLTRVTVEVRISESA